MLDHSFFPFFTLPFTLLSPKLLSLSPPGFAVALLAVVVVVAATSLLLPVEASRHPFTPRARCLVME